MSDYHIHSTSVCLSASESGESEGECEWGTRWIFLCCIYFRGQEEQKTLLDSWHMHAARKIAVVPNFFFLFFHFLSWELSEFHFIHIWLRTAQGRTSPKKSKCEYLLILTALCFSFNLDIYLASHPCEQLLSWLRFFDNRRKDHLWAINSPDKQPFMAFADQPFRNKSEWRCFLIKTTAWNQVKMDVGEQIKSSQWLADRKWRGAAGSKQTICGWLRKAGSDLNSKQMAN